MRSLVIAAMMLVSAPSVAEPVSAGAFERFDENQLLRVWTATHIFTGLFKYQHGEQVTLKTASGLRTITLAAVEKVEQARSPVVRTTALAAGAGALVGASAPFLIQLVFFGECCDVDGDELAASVAIFTGIGAVVGVLLAPSSHEWETKLGSAHGTRRVGASAPPVASLAIHGGQSLVGPVPPTLDAPMGPPTESVNDRRLSLDVTLLYEHLLPAGQLGVSLLYTSFARYSEISPAPEDEVFVVGPEYRLELLSGELAPYLGAGIKYVTSKASSTTRGRQRAIGFDGIAGVRWTPGGYSRMFLEAEARAVYGAFTIDSDTHHRLVTFSGGIGVRY